MVGEECEPIMISVYPTAIQSEFESHARRLLESISFRLAASPTTNVSSLSRPETTSKVTRIENRMTLMPGNSTFREKTLKTENKKTRGYADRA
jgi:hypothetical protein